MQTPFEFADWFRGSAPYIDKFRDSTFVILIEGHALEGNYLDALIQDFALLHTLGIRIVVVFGARQQATQALEAANIHVQELNGRAVITSEAMGIIEEQVNRARLALESRFSVGLPNTPLYGLEMSAVSGNLVMARPLGVREGVDFAHAGEVRGVRTSAIKRLLDADLLVLVPPMGHSSTGEIFDLEASEVAARVAVDLHADKLVLMGEAAGLDNGHGELLRQLSPQEAEGIEQECAGSPELARHLAAACTAARGGVVRTHLLSFNDRNALLSELFTRDGVGTMIAQDSYEQLRPASLEDVGGMLELMQPLEAKGILIHRTRERLEEQIDDYRVVVRDGMTVACAALHRFDDERMGELASLVVHKAYRGGERGEKLLAEIEHEARLRGYHSIFALTTHTAHWFLEHGFRHADIDVLPASRRANYNLARNSKVLVKPLA